jgi:D-arabinose 1-dehydrogenase-like Zn-dependent alcohol dehydrogenase
MAVKFASAFGAKVTVLGGSPNKQRDAKQMGAIDLSRRATFAIDS